MKKLVLVVSLLLVAACGKNEPFRPIVNPYSPYNPYPQMAPGPMQPYNPYGPNVPGGFRPQMPQQMPQQYTPFLPVDNYFRQNQQMMQMWNQMWMQWTQYASQRQLNLYNFAPFWYEFCPPYFQQMGMMPQYNYFNSNFYSWMSPQMQYGGNMQMAPNQFWGNYMGYPMYGY